MNRQGLFVSNIANDSAHISPYFKFNNSKIHLYLKKSILKRVTAVKIKIKGVFVEMFFYFISLSVFQNFLSL